MDGHLDGGAGATVKPIYWIIPILCSLTCSNPASNDEKNVIKILIDEPLPVGRYVVFWDGTDSNNKPLSAGNYKARLDTHSYVFEIDLTALDGTANASNDSSQIPILLPQLVTLLDQNHPNPFRIRDGTNIPFSISEYSPVRLTIRKP
jgi:hypothetical protein